MSSIKNIEKDAVRALYREKVENVRAMIDKYTEDKVVIMFTSLAHVMTDELERLSRGVATPDDISMFHCFIDSGADFEKEVTPEQAALANKIFQPILQKLINGGDA